MSYQTATASKKRNQNPLNHRDRDATNAVACGNGQALRIKRFSSEVNDADFAKRHEYFNEMPLLGRITGSSRCCLKTRTTSFATKHHYAILVWPFCPAKRALPIPGLRQQFNATVASQFSSVSSGPTRVLRLSYALVSRCSLPAQNLNAQKFARFREPTLPQRSLTHRWWRRS